MKYYKCYYSRGSYDDYRRVDVFVTNDFKKAKSWVKKFNKIIKKWKLHYSQYEDARMGFRWISETNVDEYVYDRWHSLKEINNANYEEIEFR